MPERLCCVCSEALGEAGGEALGSRDFCPLHYARAERGSHFQLSRCGVIEVALAGMFVGLVALLLGESDAALSVPAGIGLALAPALIFLVYIYRLDTLEPEPWGIVLGVFLLGGISFGMVRIPEIVTTR